MEGNMQMQKPREEWRRRERVQQNLISPERRKCRHHCAAVFDRSSCLECGLEQHGTRPERRSSCALWLAHNESLVLFVVVPTRGSAEDTCIEQPEGRRIVTSFSQNQQTVKTQNNKKMKKNTSRPSSVYGCVEAAPLNSHTHSHSVKPHRPVQIRVKHNWSHCTREREFWRSSEGPRLLVSLCHTAALVSWVDGKMSGTRSGGAGAGHMSPRNVLHSCFCPFQSLCVSFRGGEDGGEDGRSMSTERSSKALKVTPPSPHTQQWQQSPQSALQCGGDVHLVKMPKLWLAMLTIDYHEHYWLVIIDYWLELNQSN